MKFFDPPGEPSLTLSQCWSLPRALVSLASDSVRRPGEPELLPSFTATRRSEPDPAPGSVIDSVEDAWNP